MHKHLITLVAGLTLLFSANAFADTLTIKNAWSPEAPPTARVMAGYMEIHNNGKDEVLIEKVTSPQFKSIEMHRTVEKNGMSMMVWQPHVHVPPGKVTMLQPGGKHLMMMRPLKRLKAGDKIKLTLYLSDKTQQTVMATVRKN